MGAAAILSVVWAVLKKVWKPLASIVGGFLAGRETAEKAEADDNVRAAIRIEKASADAPADTAAVEDSLDKGTF